MHEGAITNVRTLIGGTKKFPITVGLLPGLALSPDLFTLVMDELIYTIQDKIPWCMLFVDSIVLIDETCEGANQKFEL